MKTDKQTACKRQPKTALEFLAAPAPEEGLCYFGPPKLRKYFEQAMAQTNFWDSLTYDHKDVGGWLGANFAQSVKNALEEQPESKKATDAPGAAPGPPGSEDMLNGLYLSRKREEGNETGEGLDDDTDSGDQEMHVDNAGVLAGEAPKFTAESVAKAKDILNNFNGDTKATTNEKLAELEKLDPVLAAEVKKEVLRLRNVDQQIKTQKRAANNGRANNYASEYLDGVERHNDFYDQVNTGLSQQMQSVFDQAGNVANNIKAEYSQNSSTAGMYDLNDPVLEGQINMNAINWAMQNVGKDSLQDQQALLNFKAAFNQDFASIDQEKLRNEWIQGVANEMEFIKNGDSLLKSSTWYDTERAKAYGEWLTAMNYRDSLWETEGVLPHMGAYYGYCLLTGNQALPYRTEPDDAPHIVAAGMSYIDGAIAIATMGSGVTATSGLSTAMQTTQSVIKSYFSNLASKATLANFGIGATINGLNTTLNRNAEIDDIIGSMITGGVGSALLTPYTSFGMPLSVAQRMKYSFVVGGLNNAAYQGINIARGKQSELNYKELFVSSLLSSISTKVSYSRATSNYLKPDQFWLNRGHSPSYTQHLQKIWNTNIQNSYPWTIYWNSDGLINASTGFGSWNY